jgi:ParB/RepB/Spo0J family partition protein
MTTATKETMTEKFEDTGAAQFLDVDRLLPNPWNRGKGAAEDLAKLAESIRAKGYLNPILARAHPKKPGFFEIVAGEQRFHAATLAGRDAIPAFVRAEMTDAEVMEVMEIENLRRVNPSPMQQAEIIRKYRALGHDTRHLAAVLGEPAHVIRRREKLLDLSSKWKKVLESKENPFALWGAAHLELIARYDVKMQDDLLPDLQWNDPGELTPAALEEWLREKTQALHLFPWKLEDETLVPKAGSCNGCSKRTGALQDLFGEVNGTAGSADSCMDKACAVKKMEAHLTRMVVQLKKEHGDCVKLADSKSYGYRNQDGTLGTDEYSLLQKHKDGAVPGVFMRGDKKGTWSWCLVGKNKTSTKAKASGASGAAAAPVTPLKELKERREKRLRCHVLQQLIDHVKGKDLTWPAGDRELLINLLYTFGTDRNSIYSTNPTWDKAWAIKKPLSPDELWTRVQPVVLEQLGSDLNAIHPDLKEAKEIAAITSFDLHEARKKAEEEIPVPASWAARAEAEKDAPNTKGKKQPASKKPRKGAPVPEDADELEDDLADDGDEETDL